MREEEAGFGRFRIGFWEVRAGFGRCQWDLGDPGRIWEVQVRFGIYR